MIKSTQPIAAKLVKGGAREKSVNGKSRPRFYAVRVFYAVFFGVGALGFVFQSADLDGVDIALIGFCTLASVISFMFSVRPPHEG